MRKNVGCGIVSLLLLPLAASQQSRPTLDWQPLSWLIGDWTGAGTFGPGKGSGSFSFQPDLQGKILVRKSFAEYPATAGKPAYRHDDLTVVFREGASFKAIYFDNEEHVIRYAIDVSPDADTVVFVSDATAGMARFRLTYHRTGATALAGKFEVASPGKPFATYLEWKAQKQATN
jgi:hypothetical protein